MYVGLEGAIKIAITVIILVFVILSLLALMMMGLRVIIEMTAKKHTKSEKELIAGKKEAITKKPEVIDETKKSNKLSEELVAVITAAIASYINTPMKKVKILKIKRAMPAETSPWAIAGMQSGMNKRITISSSKKGGF